MMHKPLAGRSRSFRNLELRDQYISDLELQQTRLLTEIQRLRNARVEIEESRNNFLAVYQQAPVGYLMFDTTGNIRDANTTALDLLGVRKESIRNCPFVLFVHKDDVRKFVSHLAHWRTTTEKRVVVEARLKTKARGPVRCELVCMPFFSGGEKLFLTAVLDLTEQERNQHALAEAKEFAENIVQTMREPLAVLDCDLKIISVNRAFSHFFRRSADLVKGRALEVLLNLWWSGNELRHKLERVLARNEPLENFQVEIEPAGLGHRILLINARSFLQKNTSRPHLLVAIEDITARRQAEEALRRVNEELERRVEARTAALQKSYEQMESFCYSIAHDLRAPLRSMKGFSQLLVEQFGPQIGDEGRDYTQRIQASAERMDQLIHDLLNYGRLNTVDLRLEQIDMEQVFTQAQSQLEKEIAEKKARIHKLNRLPSVTAHRLVLQVAFTNLLSNALKFVPPRVTPKVTLWTEEKGNRLRVWIKDNGIGIAPENQDKIFGVFQRLHTNESYPGTGIGLALVSKGIERIGGSVGVESELGKGSQFWFELEKRSASVAAT